MQNRIPMTPEGHAQLRDELERLKNHERPAVIKALAEAREHGDLSENAEYHAARERQGFIEGRVLELEDKLARADVIETVGQGGSRIMFGAKVRLVDEETDDEVSYRIVGADESDIAQGRLSVTSPLARALIGKETGDSIEVATPGGLRHFEVLDVRYD